MEHGGAEPDHSHSQDRSRSGGTEHREDSRSPQASAVSTVTDSSLLTGTTLRQKLRSEMLLVKRCIPSTAELLRILETHPEEAHQLAGYRKDLQSHIAELEREYETEVAEQEVRHKEEVFRRAEERRRAKQQQRVDEFMARTLVAEDQLQARDAERQRRKEIKEAVHAAQQAEAKRYVEETRAERKGQLRQQHHQWWLRVQERDDTEEERRRQLILSRHAETLQFERNEFEERAREEVQRHEAVAKARVMAEDQKLHQERKDKALNQRRSVAARFANRTVTHPAVKAEQHEELQRTLAARERRFLGQRSQFEQRRAEQIAAAQERIAEKRALSQSRVAQREAQRQASMEQLRVAQQVQDERHQRRLAERLTAAKRYQHQRYEEGLRVRAKRADALEGGRKRLSQKIIDRTLRIGSKLGVSLPDIQPPTPSSMQKPEAAPRPHTSLA